jgi:hypothetical protein
LTDEEAKNPSGVTGSTGHKDIERDFTGGIGGNGGKKKAGITRKNINFWNENGGESR